MMGDLLHTKLHLPRARAALVPRPRLIERLTGGLPRKLTLVSAPAGFGKTTLVSTWLAACGLPAVWLALDEEDSDPVRFLRYFVAALQTIDANCGQSIVRAFEQTPPPPLKTAVGALVNDIGNLQERFIFVLDDFHLVQSPTVHEALAYFLERQPPQIHLVIIAREDPPVPLPRWRARGELTEVRARDLRFTSAETNSFLNEGMGLNLTAAHVETLRRKTEGWVSGLQLAAVSLRGRPDIDRFVNSFAGSNRFILDYLIEEVFRRQPAEVRHFLLQTAVLEQLSAPLCDAVTRNDGAAQGMLERLEQANLFIIPLDESRQWFRYHHLFADLLRQRLRMEREDAAILHQRAGRWYEENGLFREAINHYLAAASWEEAALLIQAHNEAVQKRGENATFLRWMQMLPDSVIAATPDLCLDYAWALALRGQPDEAERFLDVAEAAFRDVPARYGNVLAAQIHLARIRHDLPQTIALSQRALTLIPPQAVDPRSALSLNLGIAYWQLGRIAEAEDAFANAQEAAGAVQNHHIRLLAVGFGSMAQAAQGQLHQAVARLQLTLQRDAALPAGALLHLVLGALHYEWNQLDDAGEHLRQAVDLARRSGNSELECSAHRQQALLLQAQGDAPAARAALAQAERVAGTEISPFTRARNNAVAVLLALAQNDMPAARARVAAMQTSAAASLFYPTLFLAPARLALAQGPADAAPAQLAAEYDRARQAGCRYGQVEIRLLQALAGGGTEEGLDFLADALLLAEPANFIRTFLDKGPALIPLLHRAVSRQVAPDYAGRLLSLLGGAPPATMAPAPGPARADPPPVDALSEREIEVLQLLADGRTNREIARAMIVSVNTVKSHLKSIYGKLNVRSRREAVTRARLLHLIPADK